MVGGMTDWTPYIEQVDLTNTFFGEWWSEERVGWVMVLMMFLVLLACWRHDGRMG